MADDKPVSSLIWQAPLLGAALGAFSTIKATGDDPDKSKEEFLKLLIRNTALGGLAGGGLYVGGKGLHTLINAYNGTVPGENRGTIVHAGSYNPFKKQINSNAKKLLSLYKKANSDDDFVNSLSMGVGTGGLAALLTYLFEKKEKNNLYNVFGTGGLAGLGAYVATDQYQKLFPNRSLKKKAESDILTNPLVWGLPAAGTLGLLSYITQTKGKRDISKILKHTLTGGLLGSGAGIVYKWAKQQPNTDVAQASDDETRRGLLGANGQEKSLFDATVPTLYNKSESLNTEDDLTWDDYMNSLKTMGAGALTSLIPWGPTKAVGAGMVANGVWCLPNAGINLWRDYNAEQNRSNLLDKKIQETLDEKNTNQ